MPDFSVNQMEKLLIAAIILVAICVLLVLLLTRRNTELDENFMEKAAITNEAARTSSGPSTWTKLNYIHSSYKMMKPR